MISAIIPAHDEEARVGETVAALATVGEIDQIIVVDDGSSDDTSMVAERAGADVLRLARNVGKGGAMNAGVKAASGDVLLFLDADLGATAKEAQKLLAPVVSCQADMAIATFPAGAVKGGGFGLAVGLARAGIERLAGRTMKAPLSGQRALKRAVWEKVGGIAPGFGAEVALTIDAVRAGFRVVEVPTRMSHRVTENDWAGIRHRGRQFLAIAAVLRDRAMKFGKTAE